jgi:tryptophanyl-tRNA synthetase
MAKKRVFSGIQPSGDLHIGNYLGAIVNWVNGQDEKENVFSIVDLHAITVPQDPKRLQSNILELAKVLLASGIDPKKSKLFLQSERPEHSEMAWILNCFTFMGELNTQQFEEKSQKIYSSNSDYYNEQLAGKMWDHDEMKKKQAKILETIKGRNVTVGLFDYPVLMAGDILLYDTDEVPVGEDQKQHVEITRNIAQRVNKRVGNVFVVPEPVIKKEGARIMSLVDPTKKMSKSDKSELSYINIRDNAETIRKKFAKATTDSENVIKFDKEKKPGISNLLNIMSVATETPIPELEKIYAGFNYGEFKQEVAERVIELLKPLQAKLTEYDKNEDYVRKVLKDGAEAVAPRAQDTLERVKKAVGLGL